MSLPAADPRHSRNFVIVLVALSLLTWAAPAVGKKSKFVAYTIVPAVGDEKGTSGPQKI